MIKILKYGEVKNEEIFARSVPEVDVEEIVTGIIENVRENGDKALYEYCEKFDKAKLSSLSVSEKEIKEAVASVEPEFLEILKEAAENIRDFHECQKRNSFIINDEKGMLEFGSSAYFVDSEWLEKIDRELTGWDFKYEEEFPDTAGVNQMGLLTNGRYFLFFHVLILNSLLM